MKISAKVLWSMLAALIVFTGLTLRYIWYDHLHDDELRIAVLTQQAEFDRALIDECLHEAEVTDRVIDDLSDNLLECLEVCR